MITGPKNPQLAEAVMQDIESSIKDVCRSHGAVMEGVKIKFDAEKMLFSGSVSWLSNGLNRHQICYLENAESVGLDPSWLDVPAFVSDDVYRIMGFYKKNYRNPVLIMKEKSGITEFLSPDSVRKIWISG